MRVWARKRAFGSALAAIASVAAMTACTSSASHPGTPIAPTPPAATQASTTGASTPKELVSSRYAFAVTLPQDWSEVDASFDWDGKALQAPGSPFMANFTAPTTGRTLVAVRRAASIAKKRHAGSVNATAPDEPGEGAPENGHHRAADRRWDQL